MSFFLAVTLATPALAKEDPGQSEAFVEDAVQLAREFELEGRKTRLLLKINQTLFQKDFAEYRAEEVLIGKGMAVLQFESEAAARKAALDLSKQSFVDSVEFDQEMQAVEPEGEILEKDAGAAVELAAEQTPWYISEMGFDRYKSMLPLETYRPIVIAVCDTGINYEDPYFEGKLAPGGYDFSAGDDFPDYDGGDIHGSVTSAIAYESARGMNVQILPIRVLPGTLMTTVLGVEHANDCQANIINLSLVYYVHSQLLEDQVQRCIDQGGVVVVAAGNNNLNMDYASAEPAHNKHCITVGAIERDFSRSNWGNGYIPNYGSSMDFVTFGSDIQVDALQKQKHAIGTSFSSPIICGIVAVLMGQFPEANYYDLFYMLIDFCVDLGEPGWDPYFGYGVPIFSGWPYNDVKNLSQSHVEAINWLYDNGIMTGLSTETFGPSVSLNRAMLATILCRLAGNPIVNEPVPFQDIAPDSYYENAVKWAYKNGLLTGYSEEAFGPSDLLTREQLSLVLYRMEFGSLGDVSEMEPSKNLQGAQAGVSLYEQLTSQYGDAQAIAEFARDSMPWAMMSNLIEPAGGKNVAPGEPATRETTGVSIYRLFVHGVSSPTRFLEKSD